mgnify:CR=1 FL=1
MDEKKDLDFNLSRDELIDFIEENGNRCALSNIPLSWKKNSLNVGSFDRIDVNKGHTTENIQLTVWHINRMKLNILTNEQIIEILNLLKKHTK